MSDFGDFTPDDAFTVGDDEVNWNDVEAVAAQIEYLESIPDDGDRLEEVKLWAAELEGF